MTLAFLVGLGAIAGIAFSAFEKHREDAADAQAKQLKLVRGLIGSEKEGFYRDPRVQAAFARLGMQVDSHASILYRARRPPANKA